MASADLTIEGERAVITAAGSGIGRTIADHLTDSPTEKRGLQIES